MCDTMGVTGKTGAFFAKNSDRSPNEPQVLEWHEPQVGGGALKATYIELPQALQTHGVLLSRPSWMWGAEMGVNDVGVAIGNEAVFTKGRYGEAALTGMDLLRLALERAHSAKAALDTIIALLSQYGQGGNCGYDHEFHYDNAFLIMDKSELYVLETCGKEWAYKKLERGAISNALTIGSDADAYSGEPCDFAATHTDKLYTRFSKALQRRTHAQSCLEGADSLADFMDALRGHRAGTRPFHKGDVGSVCMHAGGRVGDHTTASLVFDFERNIAWATGSSLPCVSLFKPYLIGNPPAAPVFKAGDKNAQGYWLAHEQIRRRMLGAQLPEEFYAERDALQSAWIQAAATAATGKQMYELSLRAGDEERVFFEAWAQKLPEGKMRGHFKKYWLEKNEALGQERAVK